MATEMAPKGTTKRTTEFKVRAYALHVQGQSAKDAFATACTEFGTTPSGCMTKYASSYMYDYKVWIAKKAATNDQQVVDLLKTNNVEAPKGKQVPVEETATA